MRYGQIDNFALPSLSLTPPVLAPPLPDVVGFKCTRWLGLEIVRPLVHHIDISRAKENEDRELRQVDEVDMLEDVLPHTRIRLTSR